MAIFEAVYISTNSEIGTSDTATHIFHVHHIHTYYQFCKRIMISQNPEKEKIYSQKPLFLQT